MKRAVFFCLAATICFGCSDKEETMSIGAPCEHSYTVSMAGHSFSKGDRLSLLSGEYKGYLTAESTGEGVVFSGKAPKLPSKENWIAVYPYSGDYSLDGRSLQMAVPSIVVPQNGSVTGIAGIGIPKDDAVALKPVTAFLRFSLSRKDIFSLVFRSEGKKVAGTLKVTVATDGVPSVSLQEGTDAIIISEKLTPGTYCIPVVPQGYNAFTVDITAAAGKASVKKGSSMRLNPGTTIDLGTIDEDADFETIASAPELELIETTATTAAVTWSITGFNDVWTDVSQAWSAGIYNDGACTDLRVSWHFPVELWTVYGGNTITTLEGPYSPRFIFTSLEPDSDYYIKAWPTANPSAASEPLKVHTKAAAFKTMPATAAEGDVILQEDFSELPWGGDVATRSFGYSDEKRSSAPAFHAAFGENPQGSQTIGGFEHKWYLVYPGTEIGLFNTLRSAVAGTRLKDWTSISEDKSDGKVLCRPGYVKLGSSNMTGGIVTPALSCLESRAVVRLSFKAHPYRDAVNDPLTASVLVINSEEQGVSVLKNYTVKEKEDFTIGENHEWKEFSYEFMVQPDDRLVISSRREGASGSQRRLLVDDIKVELLEYKPVTKVMTILNAQDLTAFLTGIDSYEAGETVTIENDIDLSGIELPLASGFKGILDGQGHKLINWAGQGKPLFANLGTSGGEAGEGTVKNLILDSSCTLPAVVNDNFGFIAGTVQKSGVIEAVTVNADVPTLEVSTLAGTRIGMIAGVSYGLIKDCTNNASFSLVTAGADGNPYLGGIVGYINSDGKVGLSGNVNNGDISYRVNAKGKNVYIGGISAGTSTRIIAEATDSRGIIENCTNTGRISYLSTNGGSMEDNAGTSGTGNYVKAGGVVGYFEGSVLNCTNRGDVTVTVPTSETGACATGPSVGGVAGFVMHDMTGCHNYGKLMIKGTFAGGNVNNQGNGVSAEVCFGGLVGAIGPAADAEDHTLSDCHNHGELNLTGWMAYVNGTAFNFGGVAGYSAVPASDCSNDATFAAESKGAYVRLGGVIGYAAKPVENMINSGKLDFSIVRSSAGAVTNYKQLATQLIIGGAVGRAQSAASGCINKGDLTLTSTAADNLAAKLQMGGSVGYAVSTFSGSNSGKVSIASHSGKQVILGGVIGEGAAQGLGSECSNTGDVSASLGTVDQTWMGGVFGSIAKPSSGNVTHTGLVNNGALSLTIENSSNSGFYYLGGVSGTSAASHVFTNCKNYGDISYTGHAKMRIGGINAYMNQTATGSVVECNITANCTGRNYSEVGGVSAYTAATNLRDWSFSGNINTSGSTAKVYTGGLLGKTNGNSSFNGCRFSGNISGGGSYNTPGIYVGGLQDNGYVLSFGSESKCTVGAGTKVNGSEITVLNNEILVSQSSCNSNYTADESFTSTGSLDNIVIE